MAKESIKEIYGSMKVEFLRNIETMIGGTTVNYEKSAYKCMLLVMAKRLYGLQSEEK